MFTGLVETIGHVAELTPTPTGLGLRVRSVLTWDLAAGESVAVNGVCLTVVASNAGGFSADIGPETARVTTLGGLSRDQPVNLERAMRADGRFGGHFVQGHVDAVGTLEEIRADGDAHWLQVRFPAALAPFFIHKGSVAMDGVSLTVATLERERFSVMIVPFTWANTNLSSLQAGAKVNLECDMVGKYVARAVQVFGSASRA